MGAKEKQLTKGWKVFWASFDAVLFALYFIAIGIVLFCQSDSFFYLDGLNGTSAAFSYLFVGVYVWMFMAVLFLVILLRSYFWKYLVMDKKKLRSMRVTVVCTLLLLNPIVVVLPTLLGQPNYVPFVQGFHQRVMNRDLDVEKLRNWLWNVNDEAFGERYYTVYEESGVLENSSKFSEEKLPFEIPKEILTLSSDVHIIQFYVNDEGERFFSIEWAETIRYHGIVIGPKKQFDLPVSAKHSLELEDGFYVWAN